MRTRTSFIFFLALSFTCAHVAASQQPRRRGARAGRAAATPAAPSRIAPRPARGPAWSISTNRLSEDSEATTLVSLEPLPTAAAAGGQTPLSFGVNFIYEGNTSAAFKNVSLSFFSRAKTCRFAAEPSVVLNLDNRPLTFPFRPQGKGADGVFWVDSNDEGGDCAETVIVYVSPATLAKIAAARGVSGRVGSEAFQLSATNLDALRALLAQLQIPQLRSAQPARPRPPR